MADAMLQGIANDLKTLEEKIKNTELYISIARNAGENVGDQERELRALITRREKWLKSLEDHGYSPNATT